MTRTSSQTRENAIVILAAGKGTRMKSDLPKVLHRIGNAPLLHHAMRTASALEPARMLVVVGHGGADVSEAARAYAPDVEIAEQIEQLGTGHAVLAVREALAGFDGDLYVLFGDTPFIRPETLLAMQAGRAKAEIVALGFEAEDPAGYGRFVLEGADDLTAIVETKDASPDQLKIRHCNSGLMAGDCATMLRLLDGLGTSNAQGEYYLTDVVGAARAEGMSCRAVFCDEAETLGINDRVQLATAEARFQARARQGAMLEGATLVDPGTVYFSLDTTLGRDVIVHPNVIFGPGVEIADGCEVKAFTHLEDTRLAPDVKVGPFARSRGGSDLASGVRIGNFVELKNAALGEGTKAGHLTYLGDASLGAGVNIGAGTITCNYDGYLKQRTEIADGAFIGVNTALIAPISVGEDAYVGTGTVLTMNVPKDALALSRTRQTNKEGYGPRLRARLSERAAAIKKAKE
jgi:bifunctional UDP-N-acetylglucosamine pyrophosphorylase/glucosamine-1-phosphate N-acetyltransferase